MRSGLCSRCRCVLTEGNCTPPFFKSGGGYCYECANERRRIKRKEESDYRKANRINRCSNKKCLIPLTVDNCTPTIFRAGCGWCNACYRAFNNERRVVEKVKLNNRHNTRRKTPIGRHEYVRRLLRKEGVPETDLLWNLNFYTEIIKDGRCHYCEGSLNPTSHALDRVDNILGHVCYNVVPCCRRCNSIKSWFWTHDEMLIVRSRLKLGEVRNGK